jgi:DNA-binding NarL/FixJ family response regulator
MEVFPERTRRELPATGEHVLIRTFETRDDLTAQERQDALVARDCLSNIEIGARLFHSRQTVPLHLGKVFSKLGISSSRAGYRGPELRVRAGRGLALRRMLRLGEQSRACLPT